MSVSVIRIHIDGDFSDIVPDGTVIFSLCEIDIETYGFSDIIFAIKLGEYN